MKNFFKIFILVNLLFTFTITAQTKWTWLNPLPTGNHVYSTYFVNQQMGYSSCASSTILKTVNGGLVWKATNIPNSYDFKGICFPTLNTGYVCGSRGVIFKTTDAGDNWQGQIINDTLNFNCIAFADANTGFAGTYHTGGRIFKTIDGGNSWTQVLNLIGNDVYSIYFVNANTILAAGYSLLKISNDLGLTWNNVGLGSDSDWNRSISFIDSNTGYILGEGNIYKTIDGAVTWSKIKFPFSILFNSICFFDQNTGIAAGSWANIWKTTNGGMQWFKVSNFSDTSREFYSIGKLNSSTAIISGEGGLILRTTDEGSSFTKISKSFTDQELLSASFIDQYTGIVSGNNGAIFKTVNSGLNWVQLNCSEANNIFKVKYLTRDTVIAVSDNGRIFKSINGGNSWNIIYRDTAAAEWSAAGFYGTQYFIIQGGRCKDAGVITKNGGLTWDTLYAECYCGSPIDGCYRIQGMEMVDTTHYCVWGQSCDPHESCNYYAASSYINLYLEQGPTAFGMSCLDTSNAIVVVGGDGISHIYRSYDGYRTFTDYDNNPGYSLLSVALLSKEIGIAYGGRGSGYNITQGIFMTTDGGQSWSLTGSPTDNILNLAYVKNKIGLAWGYYGTLVIDNNPVIITNTEEKNQALPIKFTLFQNYPNPFNPVTQIKYSIPKTALVKITVYDILGREVEKLVNGTKLPGNYTVSFNGENFASGVYFYTLKAGDYTESRKMVLIK